MGEADDCYFQVMQIVKGCDLETLIERRMKNPMPTKRTLSVGDAAGIMLQVLDALGYAHDEGVLHQDVKPANILIEERGGRPLLADFGIARTVQAEIRDANVVVGSPLYMAPERVRQQNPDARSDIFSAGVMLYKMLAGRLPIADTSPVKLLRRKARDPDSVFTRTPCETSAAIDAGLQNIILKAIATDRDLRYQSCRDFREALESYMSGR
jgi:serine/threonine-protein kinase